MILPLGINRYIHAIDSRCSLHDIQKPYFKGFSLYVAPFWHPFRMFLIVSFRNLSVSFNKCVYVCSVCSMDAWPSRLDTATIFTPLLIRIVAWLCRRSCRRIFLTPDSSIAFVNLFCICVIGRLVMPPKRKSPSTSNNGCSLFLRSSSIHTFLDCFVLVGFKPFTKCLILA